MINWDGLLKTFSQEGFSVHKFSDSKAVKENLMVQLMEKSVGFGGSMTVKQM